MHRQLAQYNEDQYPTRISEHEKKDLIDKHDLENQLRNAFFKPFSQRIAYLNKLPNLTLGKTGEKITTLRYAIIEQTLKTLEMWGGSRANAELINREFIDPAYKLIDSIFAQEPSLAKCLDHKGVNLLMLAVNYRLKSIVELCIRYGANLNQSCENESFYHQYGRNQTALSFAIHNIRSPRFIAQLLIDHGDLVQAESFADLCYFYKLGTENNIPTYFITNASAQIGRASVAAANALQPYYASLREYHAVNVAFLQGALASQIRGTTAAENQSAVAIPPLKFMHAFRKNVSAYLKPSFEAYRPILTAYEAQVAAIIASFVPPAEEDEDLAQHANQQLNLG